ncbi:MAG TPA: hypothetical protein VMC86_00245 [Gemmatimonadales bacterium]|nr:hypothetical protein [Gemmatimonadales bacterium]
MRRKLTAMALALGFAVLAAPAAGAQDWVAAKCDLSGTGHYLVASAIVYLRQEKETHFDEVKDRELRDAFRVLNQAINQAGQDKNAGAWYYLARYYIERKDLVGMDSSFTKADALDPKCHDDIYSWRRNTWVPLYNNAVHALNASKNDSAIVYLHQASLADAAEPEGISLLGTLYFNNQQYDSASVYFGKGLVLAQDPKFEKNRKDLLFNLAASERQAHHFDSAAAVYRNYLKIAPNDGKALSALAGTFNDAGHPDSARALYTQMLQHADSIDPTVLFSAGADIYNQAPQAPDTAAQGASCRDDARKVRPALTALQIKHRCDPVTAKTMSDYQAGTSATYAQAIQAFRAGLARNPYFRNALNDLTNTYFVSGQKDSMLSAGRRLYGVDPMNRHTLQLLAEAFQEHGNSDSTLHYITLADSLLPFEVTVGTFDPEDQNASLAGLFTNFHTTKSAPAKIVFEFLDGAGKVVASQTTDVPALDAGGNQPFQVQVIGAGIVAWRYKRGT